MEVVYLFYCLPNTVDVEYSSEPIPLTYHHLPFTVRSSKIGILPNLGRGPMHGKAWRYHGLKNGWVVVTSQFIILTHMLHVLYIYLQNWMIFRANVGKYTIHGAYG